MRFFLEGLFVYGRLWCAIGVVFLTAVDAAHATPAQNVQEESPSLKAALERIQELELQRKSISVTFEQTRYKALLKKTVVEKGSLEFVQPKSFRWEIFSPFKEVYVSNGKVFWKYSEVAKHAQKLSGDTGELAVLDVLFKPGSLDRSYRIEAWTVKNSDSSGGSDVVSFEPPVEKTGTLLLALFPRVKSKQKALYVALDENKGYVKDLRILHENGNRVRTVFGVFSEKLIPASRFDFQPPPGTAVDQ
jgi:outer membrane lipoprotein-sorting protein